MDKKTYLEEELKKIKSSFEAEGKTFSNWLIFPYDPKIPRGDYILVAEGEWINNLKYKFEGSQIIGDRIWHNANHIISDIAYVLTEYHPERVYGAEVYELY